MEAYLTPNTSRFERKRVRWNDGGDDDVSGSRRLHPHDAAGRDHRGHAQPVPALLAAPRMEGFFYKPRADRELLAEHADGPDRHHRLPVGRGADLAAHRRLRQGPRRRPPTSRTSSARDNYFLELMDHGLVDRDPGPRRPAPAEQGPRHPADRHQRLALRQPGGRARPRAPALRLLGQHDEPTPKRFKFDGDGYYIKSAGRDARAVGRAQRPARGLRQHAADRRALRRRVRRGQRPTTCRASRCPRARPRTPGSSRRSRRACATATPTASPTRSASRPTSRSASSPRWASRATSWSSPTSSTGPRTTASGSVPAVAPVPARWRPTRCGSPTSTRSSTA